MCNLWNDRGMVHILSLFVLFLVKMWKEKEKSITFKIIINVTIFPPCSYLEISLHVRAIVTLS